MWPAQVQPVGSCLGLGCGCLVWSSQEGAIQESLVTAAQEPAPARAQKGDGAGGWVLFHAWLCESTHPHCSLELPGVLLTPLPHDLHPAWLSVPLRV